MIIKDLRILKAIGKRYGLIFDKTFKYCLKEVCCFPNKLYLKGAINYKNNKYHLEYKSGCFYPYLVREV